jgi:hypothetical protein
MERVRLLGISSQEILTLRCHYLPGTVVASGSPNDPLLNKRVFLMPCRGWVKDPHAPESR